ncbi:acetyltransferase [Pseudobacteroides cellulosolvens]|uniref:Sugar O-acyltransferase, sialic acid O-acetyltransferase NeuD family n=1 Tax=Pseudobacteroides cellulosolvens ATCC 35603 = DSM 2933 TaxID=398512 RepID=A0A0L6JS41_9FIRM|nr:acetyltransferase [Pseudobacteroides cellulosolvens]KNY28618.1 sugar O-acyltransferase, sialic acid O-acetyltransferase NeuD family [Pseudobacteroides cellulosolvens ATCC 35603 = DSM 2933]
MKQDNGSTPIILMGAGGHSRVIIDMIRMYYNNLNVIGILDKDPSKRGIHIDTVEVIGSDDKLLELKKNGTETAFISIGLLYNFKPRMELYNNLERMGFKFPNLIHGKSVISRNVYMGLGNAVMAMAVINAGSSIGKNCIINTGSIVEHESIIGDNVHIAPGSIICGGVQIGSHTLIGAGSTVIQGVRIGNNVIVGAGSVVTKDIPPFSRVVGAPSRFI